MTDFQPIMPTPRITGSITVKGLMLRIRELILEEPARLDMGTWVRALEGGAISPIYTLNHPIPKCGSIGCLAGWGAILLRPDGVDGDVLDSFAVAAMTDALEHERYSPGSSLVFHTVGDLFAAGASFEFEPGRASIGGPGSEEQAKVIAARIDTYLERHPEIHDRVIDLERTQAILRGETVDPEPKEEAIELEEDED